MGAEAGALLAGAQLAAPARVALEELGHPQPAAPARAGSSAASGEELKAHSAPKLARGAAALALGAFGLARRE